MSKAVKKVTKAVTSVVSKSVSSASKAVSNVIKNPLPVIETIAIAAVAAPYIAPAVAAAGGGAAATAAATSAVSSAAVKAMNGGNVGDIATAAITAGAGAAAGVTAGTAVGADIVPGELTTLGKITASATGASTTTTLKELADGKSLSDAVAAGSKSFAAAGITTGAIEGLKAGFETTTPAPVEERGIATSEGAVDTQTAGQSFPLSERATQYPTIVDPAIGKSEEKLLASALYPAVYTTLFGKTVSPTAGAQITPAPQTTPAPAQTPTQTTVTPGSQALAQALRIGDVGAPIFGGDKEEGGRSGWNIESLRYTGNSEA